MTRPFKRSSDQSGQVIALVAVALVPLIGMVGFAIDVGHAYYAKHALQGSADAAALAGARELPNVSNAVATARAYSASPGGKNVHSNVGPVATEVVTKCISGGVCNPANTVVVTETADVPTSFARVFGISSIHVQARSTATGAGATPVPRDVMILLDRTGSMCQDHYGHADPSCTDLENARNGIETLLRTMNPAYDHVGLAVLPPARSQSKRCSSPSSSDYNSTSSPYVVVPLSSDYLTGASLNTSSDLISTVECVRGGGSTSYATALEKAQAELDAHGRSDIQDVIVMLSDGAANYGPTYYSTSSPYRKKPCHQGVTSAGAIKAKGTWIYTIGYDLLAEDSGGTTVNICKSDTGADESPSITARSALEQIASDSARFYNQPSAGDLTAIFHQVASDLLDVRLVDDSVQ